MNKITRISLSSTTVLKSISKMPRRYPWLVASSLAMFFAFTGISCQDQLAIGNSPATNQNSATQNKEASGINEQSIPSDAIVYFSLDAQALRTNPSLKFLPWEFFTVLSQKQIGIDVTTIDRIEGVVGNPMLGPLVAVAVSSTDPIDQTDFQDVFFQDTEWTKDKSGLNYRTLRNAPAILHWVDDRHIMIGTKPYLERVLKPGKKLGTLGTLVSKGKKSEGELRIVVSFEAVKPVLEGFAETSQDKVPGGLGPELSNLATNLDSIDFQYSIDGLGKAKILLGCVSGKADSVSQSLTKSLTVGRSLLLEQLNSSFDPKKAKKSELAITKYVERITTKLLPILQGKKEGDNVVIQIEDATPIIATISTVSSLLPALGSARQAAQRMQSSNNLKQLLLAMHNYESTYRKLPANIVDEDGKPLLSWRVALLPYIEEAELYGEFHLDEPWDSEHNIKLLDRMPAVLRHPDSVAEPGTTVYLAISGAGLGLIEPNKTNLAFANITDGLSNTVMMVEMSDTKAVPWTAPEDLTPEESNPAEGLRFDGANQGCNVGIGDGSVRFINSSIDQTLLWKLFTRNAGDFIDNF